MDDAVESKPPGADAAYAATAVTLDGCGSDATAHACASQHVVLHGAPASEDSAEPKSSAHPPVEMRKGVVSAEPDVGNAVSTPDEGGSCTYKSAARAGVARTLTKSREKTYVASGGVDGEGELDGVLDGVLDADAPAEMVPVPVEVVVPVAVDVDVAVRVDVADKDGCAVTVADALGVTDIVAGAASVKEDVKGPVHITNVDHGIELLAMYVGERSTHPGGRPITVASVTVKLPVQPAPE